VGIGPTYAAEIFVQLRHHYDDPRGGRYKHFARKIFVPGKIIFSRSDCHLVPRGDLVLSPVEFVFPVDEKAVLLDEKVSLPGNIVFSSGNIAFSSDEKAFSLDEKVFLPGNIVSASGDIAFPTDEKVFLLDEKVSLPDSIVFSCGNIAFPAREKASWLDEQAFLPGNIVFSPISETIRLQKCLMSGGLSLLRTLLPEEEQKTAREQR